MATDADVIATPGKRLSAGPAILPAVVLLAITIVCNLPMLRNTPLAGTEGHRAITAEQMISGGNWILPKLFGRYYLAKPPMQYWLIALSHFIAGGGNALVWRMPGIIAAGLLNATLCLFAGRWFGRTAAWVAGWSGFGLIALWGQVPSADVDSVDTFFAILAALPMIELLFGKPRRLIGWVLLAGLSTGAMLLTKGPAGLLPISGVLIWGVFATLHKDGGPTIRPPSVLGKRWSATLVAFFIGVAIFGGYIWLAYWKLHHSTLPADYEGVEEGARRLVLNSHRFVQSLDVPLLLFLYAFPISLGLLMLPLTNVPFGAEGRSTGAISQNQAIEWRRIANALAFSVLFSWLVALLTATENPRWVYTTLPLLCPLAGAVVAGGLRLPANQRRGSVGIVFSVSILLYAGAAAVFSVLIFKSFPADHSIQKFCWIITALTAITAVVACADLAADRISRAGSMAAITLVLASVPFTLFNRLDRTRRSAFMDVPQLLAIVGPHPTIGVGHLIVSQPELLYYARVNVRPFMRGGPASLPGFTQGWVIATPDELKAWRQQGSIIDIHKIKSGKVDTAYVGWFNARK